MSAITLAPSQARSGFFDPFDDDRIIDTQIVAGDPSTGVFRLANGMILDQRIERFVIRDPLAVGNRVRLRFDGTNFLRRVSVLD
ncbi:MAG: hypothetical protein AAF590_03100 [Pseudomonadota bacterium]